MSEEKDQHHFAAYMVSEEKNHNTFRHQMRENPRYMNHPYGTQSSSRLDRSGGSAVPNNTHNNNGVISSTASLPSSNNSNNNNNNSVSQMPSTFIPQMKTPLESSSLVSMDQSEDAKATDLIKLPENLENLPKADEFPTKRNRWNTNEEILALLLNFSKHDEWQSKDVVIRPESGSMLMYSRKKVRYRRDGYCWKKRKDGKTTREDHMKLKVQGVENPDIVLVHYLNVPYPDDSKLAALIPNIAFWTEKKEWTREELLLQLKPMYETPTLENGSGSGCKENETEEAKLTRINEKDDMVMNFVEKEQGIFRPLSHREDNYITSNSENLISTFIESMIAQLLEKQRYVRTALSNSLECGCGNRKCLGASRCTRPIRRITSAKKPVKRTSGATATVKVTPDKRPSNCNERNVLKTTPMRKISGVNANSRTPGSGHHTVNSNSYYGSTLTMSGGGANTDLTELSSQPQIQQNSPQLQQLLQAPAQSDVRQRMNQNHEQMQPKLVHQQMAMQTPNSKEFQGGYSRSEDYIPPVNGFVSPRSRHYQPNFSSCPMVDTYVPNNEMEINNVEKQEPSNMNESVSTLIPYSTDESEYHVDKYQSDTTDASDCTSYTTTTHHQASPSGSLTSADGTEVYANGDPLEDLMSSYTDHSLCELIIQLTQKEKTTCTNSVVTCEKLQQYSMQNETSESYTPAFENDVPIFGSDANGNFLNSCLRYTTTSTNGSDDNVGASTHATEFTRIENSYITNYPNADVNFINASNEFSGGDRSSSSHPVQEAPQSDPPCMILDFAPEWSYCEGGTKLLIIGPWYFQSEYAVLFDSYSVPATLLQAGVLRCYCPEHAVGLVSLQVVSAGSIISNSVVFEYKKRPHYDENVCHNTCNIKAEQCNQYTYENDTLLKFILIQRFESIQEDAYKHSSVAQINKYEALPEKTCT